MKCSQNQQELIAAFGTIYVLIHLPERERECKNAQMFENGSEMRRSEQELKNEGEITARLGEINAVYHSITQQLEQYVFLTAEERIYDFPKQKLQGSCTGLHICLHSFCLIICSAFSQQVRASGETH